ncbi:hypothetical protein BASA50_007267 [Batrachochytrium salamandrivorans]|uniref:Uncharacterized protein n=1 Tax=Batrachochytrium salamandrivorans TaxID=1357716 RepID=A0ABQ8F8R4_9FUNG|nr:hypothetical protein BASA50_007267 [Batrachochytrium salamandrivorans]
MQFSTIVISAIAVIASVHGAAIPAMDTPASSPVELEARSYNDQDSNSENNLEKRSPGYGTMGGNFNNPMMFPQHEWDGWLSPTTKVFPPTKMVQPDGTTLEGY